MTNTIGDYEVYEELGRGGMAVVYRALDTHTGQIVALKVLRSEVSDEPEALARLSREGRTANQLSHPNIVRVFDYGESGGQLFIAMECVQGETLSQRLAREFQFTEAETQRITLAVARALDAAYQHGVVHRDIKPANVLLAKTGEIKVSDFGLARAVGTRTVTQRGAIVGTLAYMSPEVLDGKEDNIRRDLYALGVMMHEMLTGLTPFEAKSESEMLKKKLSEQPDLRPVRRASEALAPIVERLIRTKPEERYPTPAALIEALEGQADLQDAHIADLTKPLPARFRASASSGLSSIIRLPRPYKLGLAGAVALLGAGVAILAIAGAFGGNSSGVLVREDGYPSFSTGTDRWEVFEVRKSADGVIMRQTSEPSELPSEAAALEPTPDPETLLPVLGNNIGDAQVVCLDLDFPANCPEGALIYYRGREGGWEIPPYLAPDAHWIWAPKISANDVGDYAAYYFRTTVRVDRKVDKAMIAIVADNRADVFIAGEYWFSTTGPNTVTFYDIHAALNDALNDDLEIAILVRNEGSAEPAGNNPNCDSLPCSYKANPAGLIVQGPFAWEWTK